MSIKQGQNVIAGRGSTLPAQSGMNGRYLFTDGETASWKVVETMPLSTLYGYSLRYVDDHLALLDQHGQELNHVTIVHRDPDNITITYNSENKFQAEATVERNLGDIKYDWIGTLAEWTAQSVATTHPTWICYITDDSEELEIVTWGNISNKPNFSTVAFSGSYTDLINTPDLATVAYTGNYNNLVDLPTIGSGTLTINKNGTELGSFSANSTKNYTVDIPSDIPDQNGYSGKFLSTDGSVLSWGMPVKIGTIVRYAGQSIPEGYLVCDGSEISRSDYSDLFNAIGTLYGSGDDSSTFNLPDDTDDYVIDSKVPTSDDPTWYRIYKSGWVEQGGRFTNTARSTTITLPIQMSNNSYYASVMLLHCGSGWSATVNAGIQNNSLTTTSFVAQVWHDTNNTTGLNAWEVKGLAGTQPVVPIRTLIKY